MRYGLALIGLAMTLAACAPQPALSPTSTPVPTSPYVPLLDSPIRGLSPDEIQELEAGAGAGLARAAELNGYPGPRHILDLHDQLGLSEDQHAQVQALYDAMNAEARRLGADILRREGELELAFRSGRIDETTLTMKVMDLADQYGELRALHLRTHLTALEILTPEQLALYNQLRGYAQPHPTDHGDGHTP
jgi:Spy/CpxP family protein refolding chaperone